MSATGKNKSNTRLFKIICNFNSPVFISFAQQRVKIFFIYWMFFNFTFKIFKIKIGKGFFICFNK